MTWRRVGFVAAAAALLVACSSSDDGSGSTDVGELDEDADVTITWWHGQNAEAADILSSLAREYEADNPGVTIDDASGASTTDELLQKMQAGFASDTYPDICYSYGSWVTELGLSGRTLDIADLVDDKGSGWEEFPKAAQETADVEGTVVGFPAVLGNLALMYNTALFDQAGLDHPDESWTWDDFRSAAKALSDPERNIYGTAYPVNGSEDTTWRLWPQLWQNGGEILDDDGKPAFDSEAGVEAVELWRQMAVEDESVYLDQNGEKYIPSFLDGNIGMIISGPWVLYDLKERGTPYGVTVLPGTDGDHQTIAGVDLWVLFDHDDEQRAAAAYDFTRWLTEPAQDVRWNVEYGNLPLRSSAADTPEFEAYTKKYPGAQTFFDNLDNAVTPRPTVQGYTALSRAVGTAISAVLQGAEEPEAALHGAAEQAAVDMAG